MTPLRMAQYGTKHGHALGKLLSMAMNPDVEVVGIYEPDPIQRQKMQSHLGNGPLRNIPWFDSKEEMLGDPSIVAIASEGLNSESLARQHGEDRGRGQACLVRQTGWRELAPLAAGDGRCPETGRLSPNGLHVPLPRRFPAHRQLGQIRTVRELFSVRAHMSTWISPAQREVISEHRAGIFFDLGGHMLDQVVWLLGRPTRTTGFFHNHNGIVPAFSDNTLGVLEYEKAIAVVDIAAMELLLMARRFEVYGSKGSAILLEPFEPGHAIRLCLEDADGGYRQGNSTSPFLPRVARNSTIGRWRLLWLC